MITKSPPAHVLAYIAGIVSHPAYTQTFADELTTPGIRVPFTTDPALWDQAVKLGNQVIWLQTYGAAFSSPDRPQANVRLPAGDPRQPLCTKPITSMPESIAYDSERHVLAMGDGRVRSGPPRSDGVHGRRQEHLQIMVRLPEERTGRKERSRNWTTNTQTHGTRTGPRKPSTC